MTTKICRTPENNLTRKAKAGEIIYIDACPIIGFGENHFLVSVNHLLHQKNINNYFIYICWFQLFLFDVSKYFEIIYIYFIDDCTVSKSNLGLIINTMRKREDFIISKERYLGDSRSKFEDEKRKFEDEKKKLERKNIRKSKNLEIKWRSCKKI